MTGVELLDWDTEFFGYPVGRLTTGDMEVNEDQLVSLSEQFKLVYVVSNKPQTTELLLAGDSKIIFQKTPERHDISPTVVTAKKEAIEEFKRIGRQSGIWSRFAIDEGFQNQEFERLYDRWVTGSIENEIAFANLTVLDAQQPTGLITVAEVDADNATIGLFAVSEKHRGKGIGTRLLQAVDTICADKGYRSLTVATQGKNTGAQMVYERFGFRPLNVTYIYNYWNEAYTVQ